MPVHEGHEVFSHEGHEGFSHEGHDVFGHEGTKITSLFGHEGTKITKVVGCSLLFRRTENELRVLRVFVAIGLRGFVAKRRRDLRGLAFDGRDPVDRDHQPAQQVGPEMTPAPAG